MLGKDLMCAKEWVMVPPTEPRNTAGCMCLCGGLVAKSCLTVTPWTVAHQASLSMGFLRQEYWSGLPFPSPGESSWPRGWTGVSWIVDSLLHCRWVLYRWDTRGAHTCVWANLKPMAVPATLLRYLPSSSLGGMEVKSQKGLGFWDGLCPCGRLVFSSEPWVLECRLLGGPSHGNTGLGHVSYSGQCHNRKQTEAREVLVFWGLVLLGASLGCRPAGSSPRGVRTRLEGKQRTPLSSQVATRISWSPLSGLKGSVVLIHDSMF